MEGGVELNNIVLGATFEKLRGTYYHGGGGFSEGQVGAKFLEGGRILRATMFFCKLVIPVSTLFLVIHITMYILML